ncbi:heavy metal translocating P-type ATPase [Chryseobacterium sp.]|uniref:heavy metal translocating P-type ATPase n=1 Tax=Chryseobacterium sp. TaxID=1871047 RepID=UPI0028962CDB|nr:heavy metal translocating P-type ATPase [Chryseobacterium sp.]
MSKECCSHPNTEPANHHDHDHSDGHTHDSADQSIFQMFLPAGISFILLMTGIFLDYYVKPEWFSGWVRFILYLVAYIPVGVPVLKEAVESIRFGDFFSEFFLMSLATLGAFGIGEFPEGVAVMLFYSIGENFQSLAVQRAKKNIKTLLDQRPDEINILKENKTFKIKAEEAEIGDIIQLKPGEKLALDGELISEKASFNTSALTGESTPDTKKKGDEILAGMINLNSVSEIVILRKFKDSKLSRILELVQNATTQKAQTELFIRKFAKIYTPIVTFLALGIALIPYFIVENYDFKDWLYRALVFLVISCPCALVISIPLGYFGGIGAGSKNGILFKGGNFLDILSTVQNVVMDKTGTLTEGVFKVKDIKIEPEFNQSEILKYLNFVESKSTHPIAMAIHEFAGEIDHTLNIENVEEVPGYGLKAEVNGNVFLAGNFKLMKKFGLKYNVDETKFHETVIAIAYQNKFAGYITIADKIKSDAQEAVSKLKNLGIKITMLSGDKSSVVQEIAKNLNIDNAFGDLLPEDKVNSVKNIKSKNESVAFVGDGLNDAPVIALSDVGIAMGGLGSDATIETADVIIQDDKPSKIATAIKIGKETKKIVWQNIILAFGVKAIVLILGAGGIATMWEAVFADVGVALLAILNAVRIQNMNFRQN